MSTDIDKSFYKPYNSVLRPNKRKKVLLSDTIDFNERGQEIFLKIFLSLYGGITPDICDKIVKDGVKNPKEINTPLICALNWFVPVEKSCFLDKHFILPSELKNNFINIWNSLSKNSLPTEELDLVNNYFNSNLDLEKYGWLNCHEMFTSFCQEISSSQEDLRSDISHLIRFKMLPLNPTKKKNIAEGWKSVSNLFGVGKKENSGGKAQFLSEYIDFLNNQPNDISLKDYNLNLLKRFNCSNSEELCNKSKGEGTKSGAPPFFMTTFGKRFEQKDFSKDNLMKSAMKKLKDKNDKAAFKYSNDTKIKDYVSKKLESKFHQPSWANIYMNGLMPIIAKLRINYNFVISKNKDQNDLNKIKDKVANELNILVKFFESPFYTNKLCFSYNITSKYLKDFGDLLKIWKETEISPTHRDDGIEHFCNEQYNNGCTVLNKELLKYLYDYRNLGHILTKDKKEEKAQEKATSQKFIDAAKCNTLSEKLSRQKVNPIVLNKSKLYYSTNSSLKGFIQSPREKHKNGNFNGTYPSIFTTLELYNKINDKWEEHHIPFSNSRFFEEIYAYNEMMKIDTDFPRTARNKNNSLLLNEGFNEKYDKEYLKFNKRRLRALNNKIAFKFNIDNAPFTISKNGNKFNIDISYKFKLDREKFKGFKIGDRILSYDPNWTASCAYAVSEIATAETQNALYHEDIGHYILIIKTGKIEFFNKFQDGKEIDTLSYLGIRQFAEWKELRNSFVKNLYKTISDKELNDQNKEKSKNKNSKKKLFENTSEFLYEFNTKYIKQLNWLMKNKYFSLEDSEIRNEIFELVNGIKGILKFGSLSHVCIEGYNSIISLINSYLSLCCNNENKEITDDNKQKIDPEIFNLRENIIKKRKSKKEQRANVIFATIIDISNESSATYIGSEDLDNLNNEKGKKKSFNSKNSDWYAKAVCKKLNYGVPFYGKYLIKSDSYYGSHQNPFIHTKNNKSMFARFEKLKLTEIKDCHLKSMSVWLKYNYKKVGTNVYYKKGCEDFIEHYKLQQYKELLLNNKMPVEDLQKVLQKEEFVYFPKKGGRIYFATCPITTNYVKFIYNSRDCYICDADEIAAVNQGLKTLQIKPKN